MRELVIPLRTSFKLAHLFLPRRRVAVQVALRHPWANNNTLLSAQGDFSAWSGHTGAPSLPHTSMRISKHILSAVTDVVNWEMGYGVGMDDDTALFDHTRYFHTDKCIMRRRIYKSLINVCANHADVDADVARKLAKWDITDASPTLLNTHFHSFSTKLNPHMRYVQFAMLFNALVTDRRYNPIRNNLGGGSVIDACYVCGDGEDSVLHLYGEGCLSVCAARVRFGLAIGSDLTPANYQADSTLQFSLLAFPFVGPPLTHAIVCFNWAVWQSSRVYFKTLGYPPARADAAARICEMATNAWLGVAEPGWHRAAGTLPTAAFLRSAPRPAHERNPFGSAGQRTPQQRANCTAYAAALLAGCGSSAAVAFTDGAASPNPGPCGAGASISLCGKHQVDLAQPIGTGTNNNGELWAIGMVAKYLTDHSALLVGCCALFILSDSKLIVDAINGDIKYRSEPELLAYVQGQLARVASYIPYSIQWTPGHCGSAGNNAADALAGAGAGLNGPAGPRSFHDLLPPG